MQRIAMATAGAMLVLAAMTVSAQEKMPETPYFPLRVGTTWHYKSADSKFLVRVAAHEKVGDGLAARLETVKDGKVIATEHLRVTAEGVVRLDVSFSDGDKKVTEVPKPAILVLRLPPKKGDAFSVNSTVNEKVYKGTFKIGEDEVKVPAGTYKAILVSGQDVEVEGVKPTMRAWYAENVGLVKQEVTAAGTKTEFELEKFEPGQ
jgi:hypothetical protein